MSLCVSVFLCVSLCFCVSVCLSISVFLCLCVRVCVVGDDCVGADEEWRLTLTPQKQFCRVSYSYCLLLFVLYYVFPWQYVRRSSTSRLENSTRDSFLCT